MSDKRIETLEAQVAEQRRQIAELRDQIEHLASALASTTRANINLVNTPARERHWR